MLLTSEARFTQFGCGLCAPPRWLNFDASPAIRLQRLPIIGNLVPSGQFGRFPENVKYGYLGFLKCYYTAGMLGGIAGYFRNPEGGFDATFPADRPPNWLQQMIALSRVHGLFSHLEVYLRQGDLLLGPANHIWSKDTPAYEFPSADSDIRVLARKHRQKSAWLIAVWAAAGNSRKVTVTLPQLGSVALLARPSGSVYTAEIVNNQPKFNWVDRQEMRSETADSYISV